MAYTSPTIAPSGTTFAQFQAGGVSGLLERLIAANLAGTGAPGAPTLSATGGGTAGGSLAAGTYYIKVTETNGIGETTASPEVSVAVAAGNIPGVHFGPLRGGNAARNLYVGIASGEEVLYAGGIRVAAFNLSAAMPTDSSAVPPPKVNTTGLFVMDAACGSLPSRKLASLRACEKGRLQGVWDNLAGLISQFNRGEPVSYSNVVVKLRDAHTVFALLAQLCAEAGQLIDANPGRFTNVSAGIGGQKTVRRWP